MQKLFTNAWLLLLACALSACSATQSTAPDLTEPQAETQQQTVNQAPLRPARTVVVPPLKSGNQALFERAVALLQAQKYEAAQVLLLELTDSQPELAGPWVNLSFTYLAMDELASAERSLQRALQANPQNCDALNQLGIMARRQGDFSAAEAFYQRCVEADPNFAPAYMNLGILYELYMGQLGEALAAYNDYQIALPEPDRRVAGWVIDLERRVGAIAQR